MPTTISKDSNGKIIKRNVPFNTNPPVVNGAPSLGSVDINYNGSINSLKLNNVQVTSTGSQLNYANVTPGIASASKAIVLNSNSSISNLNAVSCTTSITINGNLVTGTNLSGGNISYLTDITPGSAGASKVAVLDSNSNISGLNSVSTNTLSLNDNKITVYNREKLFSITNHTIENISNDNQWNSMCWSPSLNLFVAVASTGSGNRVMTSSNGNTWTIQNSPVDNDWRSICWSSDLSMFVAVASSGTGNRVMTSSNGINWSTQISAVDNNWTSVCWASELSLFVAVASTGSGDQIMTSADGIAWSSRTSPNVNTWSSVCWSSALRLLVAVASGGTVSNQIMTSVDGINWTSRISPVANSWTSVCWGSNAGMFVAVSNTGSRNRSMLSVNGIDWYFYTTLIDNDWNNIIYSQELSMFIAVASVGSNGKIAYSINGNKWKFINTSIDNGLSCISWSPSLKVFSILSINISNISNKITLLNNWNSINTNFPSGSSAKFVTWISELNLFVYSGTNGLLMTSYNGIDWTLRSVPSATWNSVTYSPSLGMLVAVSNNSDVNNAIVTSVDGGITWTSRIAPFGYNWYSVCWSSSLSLFVAIANASPNNSSTIITSTNGINWTSRTATAADWKQVKWIESLSIFIAIGSSSPCVMTSSNGITWTNRTPSTTTSWKAIDWSPMLNSFVAVADGGATRVMTSPDGINWTNRTSQVTSQWYGVCWCSNLNLFIVVSYNSSSNSIMYSSDAINWTTLLSKSNYLWNYVCFSPYLNTIVAVADSTNMQVMKTNSYYNCFVKSSSVPSSKLDLTNVIESKYPTISKIRNVLRNINSYTSSTIMAWSYVTVINFKTGTPSWATSKYYVAASTSLSAYSLDGINWTALSGSNGNKSIAFSNTLNIGVSVGSDAGNRIGYFGTSYSMAAYTAVTTTTNNWNSVCWSPELSMFVAVASSGTGNRAIISYNGTIWTHMNSSADNNWTCICWSPDLMLFVAVASSGTGNRVMTSPNGITWTSQVSAVDNNWTSVCWSPELSLFVAVASSGTGNRIMTSPNGINWTSRTSPEDNSWNQIIWIPELYIFVSCASTGTNRLMYSINGINWTALALPVNNRFTTLCWNTDINRLIIMSSDGTSRIFKSNVFNLTNYNSISNNYWKINPNTGNVSLFTNNNNPDYKFEYSNGNGENVIDSLILYSPGASNFSINTGPDGSLSFSSPNGPILNIVNHNGSTSGLALNGTLVTATATNLNSINKITFGNTKALKALTTDSKRNIYGVNNISCNTLSMSDVYSVVVPGTVAGNMPIVSDSNNNIYNFNKISTTSLISSGKSISTNNTKLVNNALYSSFVNYTASNDLGSANGQSNNNKALIWVPELNKAVAIRYNNSGSSTTVSTSTDGINWTSVRNINIGDQCINLIWSPELKLCLATFKMTYTYSFAISYDLENWSALSLPSMPVFVNCQASCWSSFANLFVIFASNRSSNSIFTSPDAINWSSTAGPQANFYNCISVPSPINLILTIGDNSVLYYSSNGINWTNRTLSGFSGNWYFAYSPSLQKIVAVANGLTAQSSDGINWTKNSCPGSDWCAIEWAEELGIFITVSQSDASVVMISKNGINWYLRSNYIAMTGQFNSPVLTNVKWVSSLNRFIFCTKTDIGDRTTNNTIANIMGYSNASTFSNFDYSVSDITQTINIPSLNKIIKKSKGAVHKCLNTWHSRYSAADINWSSVCYSNVSNVITFVAVASGGSSNGVMTSPDGKNWTAQTPASDNDWTSVCWSPGLSLFAAVASSGTGDRIMTSPDGIAWTPQTSAADNNWTSVCWSSELDLFVAIASSGTDNRIMTSSDGITWTSRTSPANNNWTSICWSKELNLFVAVASSGTGNRVMTSPDGINWISRTSAANNNWTSVCWSSDRYLFIAVASSGTGNRIMTSPDGINWNIQYSAADYNWVSICWAVELNCAIAISNKTTIYNKNAIMISYDCYKWQLLKYTNINTWTSFVWSPDYAMFVAVSNTGMGNRVLNSTMAFETYKTSVNASLKFITTVDSTGSTGLGITPSYKLHLSTDSAAKPATSTWTVSSDERLKENIQDADIDQCYNDVNKLRLTKYTWKNEVYTVDEVPDRSKLGWIAQEVEQIYPKAVEKHNMHGYEDCRTLNTDQIIASLYGCIQKLIQKCETRQTTIDTLKSKHDEIKSVLDSLEIVNE